MTKRQNPCAAWIWNGSRFDWVFGWLTGLFIAVLVVFPVRSQDANWDGRFGSPNLTTGYALAATADGQLYVGGNYQWNVSGIGGLNAHHISRWDGTEWLRLGNDAVTNGVGDPVHAIVTIGNDVYVGGEFFTVSDPVGGVQSVNAVAKWDGTKWSRLGANLPYGVAGQAYALATDGTNLYVGGRFASAGGISATNIVKWDGQQWTALGGGLGTGESDRVAAIAIGPDGAIYAGGSFTTSAGADLNRIAKWNGTNWTALGSGVNNFVNALAFVGTDLYVGGEFSLAGGSPANALAKWNGTQWSEVGGGMTGGSVFALAVKGAELYVGGSFTAGGSTPLSAIGKWNGTAWSDFAGGTRAGNSAVVYSLLELNGDIYAGGFFTSAGEVAALHVARWNGTKWTALTKALGGVATSPATPVLAITPYGTNIYVGGQFTTAGGVAANRLAVWNGSDWSAPGGGTNNGFGKDVRAIAVSPSGEIYAGGEFSQAGTNTLVNIARWNGTNWSPLGNGLLGSNGRRINALAMATNGDLIAAGTFEIIGGINAAGVARWDGTNWWDMADGLKFSGAGGFGFALAVSGNDLYVSGRFDTAGGVPAANVARWDGVQWHSMGAGVNGNANALAIGGNNLYVGGAFTQAGGTSANRVARWDGLSWHNLGAGVDKPVNAIAIVGDEVFIGGTFTLADNKGIPYLARWVGGNWWPVGSGINGSSQVSVAALAVQGDNLFVGGNFKTAGEKPADGFARWGLTNTLTPPQIKLTSPTTDATFLVGSTITLVADVSEFVGTTNVEFYAGSTLLGTATSEPFTLTWSNVFTGDYSLVATATDGQGFTINSMPVPIHVRSPTNNLPPVVNIDGPANGTVFSTGEPIEITVSASDPEGDSVQVTIYEGVHLLATFTNLPYSLTWSNSIRSTYTLSAVAADGLGVMSTSAPVNIRIQSTPEVLITGPGEGDVFVGPRDIQLTADARDVDGQVTNVQFYISGNLLGSFTSFSSPNYHFTWANVPLGTYSVTALAYDDLGGKTLSRPVTFSVVAPNTKPTVQILSPANGSIITAPTNIVILADATDSDGQVVEVRFFGPAGYLGSASNAPFSFNWQNLAVANVCLSAIAVDDRGALSSVSQVCISITNDPANAPRYLLTDLGLVAGRESRAYGINDAGHVTGEGVSPQNASCPFIFAGGVMQFLDSAPDPIRTGAGLAINHHDAVVGYDDQMAFLYATGQVTRLGSLGGPSGRSLARAINDSGLIVGNTLVPNGKQHAFLYASQQMLDLGTLGGNDSDGFGINNSGQVVGWSQTTDGFRAFLYDQTNGLRELITGGTQNSQAFGINDDGAVVGLIVNSSGYSQAFLYESGELMQLGTLGGLSSEARDINNTNQVVGNSLTAFSEQRAMLWQGHVMFDLNQLVEQKDDWDLRYATAINDAGQIVGYGRKGLQDGRDRAFLLTPIPPNGQTNQPPVVRIEAPINGAKFFQHDSVIIEVAASDDDGDVARVDFLAGTNLLGSLTNRPFNLTWSDVPAGTFSIVAVATDNQGTSSTSSPVNVIIIATDPNAPKVAIVASTSPEYLADVKSKIQETGLFNRVDPILVRRTDPPVTLTQLQSYDSVLVFSDDLFNTSVGLGDVLANYVDAGGGVVSASFEIEGRFLAGGYQPFTNGVAGLQGNLSLLKDLPQHPIFDGVATFSGGPASFHEQKIDLTANTSLLGHWSDGEPLVVTKEVNTGRVVGLNIYPPSSDVSTNLWVSNSDGGRLMANALIWAAKLPSPVSVSIASPVEGLKFYPNELVSITAVVTASNATVTQVEFFADDQSLGTDTDSPYNVFWTNAVVGDHALTAVATDVDGRKVISPVVKVSVASRLSVHLLSPTPGAIFYVPTNITFLAEVTDLDAQVTNVQFYVGPDKLGEATNAPFTVVWENVGVGTFDVTARASDSLGTIRTSSPSPITIINLANPVDTVWIGAAGTWFAPSNWTSRVPFPQDRARINNGGTAVVASGNASAQRLTIGDTAAGNLWQTGGTLAINDMIILGDKTGGLGSYILSETGVLNTRELGVGLAGTGVFTQNGGTTIITNLYISGDVNGNGTYELNGGQMFSQIARVATHNVGLFRQRGGTNSTSFLFVGNGQTETQGRYELHEGRLVVFNEVIGNDGTGFFRQTGGENLVSGDFELGRFWSGTYEITNGLLAVSNLLLETGVMSVQSQNAQIIVSNRLVFGGQSSFVSVSGSSLRLLGGAFDIQSFRLTNLSGVTNLNLIVEGQTNLFAAVESSSNPQLGFAENTFLGTLTIGDTSAGRVKLVDQRDNDNQGNPGDEAMFIRELRLNESSVLDLNGVPLFVHEMPVLNGELRLSQGAMISTNGLRIANGATLRGAGIVGGSLSNDGRIDLGESRGRIQINGEFSQSANGSLNLVVAGTNSAGGYDQFAVSGTASLGGVLDVQLAADNLPTPGDSFRIITFQQRDGIFSTVHLPGPTNGMAFQLSYFPDAIFLEVIVQPDLQLVAPVRLNPQTGLYEAFIQLSNAGPATVYASRILIYDLPPGTSVYNASGLDAGIPFIRFDQPLATGETVTFVAEFYVPDRRTVPDPTFIADAAYLTGSFDPEGSVLMIERSLMQSDGSFIVEFNTIANRIYYVQYTDDSVNWKTALPAITGTGSRVQWIDNGPPKTSSRPGSQPSRFYRIVLLP